MFATLVLAVLSQGIAYNTPYDCGARYVTFTVNSCSGAVCDVTYRNPGQAWHRTRWPIAEIQTGIARGCHPTRYAAQPMHLAAPARVASRPAAGGNIVLGKYECYALSGGELESAMALNFTLYAGGRFTDYTGHPGTWSYSGGFVTMSGTGLNGQRLKYTPGVPRGDNPPHLTFMRGNEESDSCDGVG